MRAIPGFKRLGAYLTKCETCGEVLRNNPPGRMHACGVVGAGILLPCEETPRMEGWGDEGKRGEQ